MRLGLVPVRDAGVVVLVVVGVTVFDREAQRPLEAHRVIHELNQQRQAENTRRAAENQHRQKAKQILVAAKKSHGVFLAQLRASGKPI